MDLSATKVHLPLLTGRSLLRIFIRCILGLFSRSFFLTASPNVTTPRPGGSSSCACIGKLLAVIVLLSWVLAVVGCQHIGPPTVSDDRLAYNRAIKASWEQQALLNLVRVRYHDLVQFVDVGPVTQTHTLQETAQGTFAASLLPHNFIGNTLSPSLQGTQQRTDSPAIVYTPLAGSDFTRNLNAPIKPVDLFCNLIEAGFSPDTIMEMSVSSINGIPSTVTIETKSSERSSDPDCRPPHITNPDFATLALAIKDAHEKGDVSFPAEVQADGSTKVFMLIAEKGSRGNYDPIATIRAILRLKAAITKFEIVAEFHAMKETEIAVRTRSVINTMIRLSEYVQVPERHLRSEPGHEGRLVHQRNVNLADNDTRPLITVKSSLEKPPRNSFVSVQYHGYWFWIPEEDYRSRSALIYMRTFLAMADTGARPTAPVLTIPTR